MRACRRRLILIVRWLAGLANYTLVAAAILLFCVVIVVVALLLLVITDGHILAAAGVERNQFEVISADEHCRGVRQHPRPSRNSKAVDDDDHTGEFFLWLVCSFNQCRRSPSTKVAHMRQVAGRFCADAVREIRMIMMVADDYSYSIEIRVLLTVVTTLYNFDNE